MPGNSSNLFTNIFPVRDQGENGQAGHRRHLDLRAPDRRGRLPMDELLRAKLSGIRVEDASTTYERLTGAILLEDLKPSGLIFSDGFHVSTLRRAVKFQFLIGFPVTIGLVLLSDRLIPVLFHKGGFRESAVALQVIGLGITFIFLNLMARYVMAALNEQRAYLRAIVFGLVVNVGASAALIPSMGFVGACIGLIAGELTVLIGCQRKLHEYLPFGHLLLEAVRPLLAALGMGVVVFLLKPVNVLVLPVIGAVVYGVLLLLLRALTEHELDILRRVYVSFRLPGSAYLSRRPRPTLEPVPSAPAGAVPRVIPHEES